MKKIMVVLIMTLTMMTRLFADVKLMPKDKFNSLSSALRDESVRLQIGYIADTWEDVYKKTNIGEYSWKESNSGYIKDGVVIRPRHYEIIKLSYEDDLGWVCIEYPGDGSFTLYVADIED